MYTGIYCKNASPKGAVQADLTRSYGVSQATISRLGLALSKQARAAREEVMTAIWLLPLDAPRTRGLPGEVLKLRLGSQSVEAASGQSPPTAAARSAQWRRRANMLPLPKDRSRDQSGQAMAMSPFSPPSATSKGRS
jgi:hypothetical protein